MITWKKKHFEEWILINNKKKTDKTISPSQLEIT
jgi:hypothetical protein